MTVASWIVAPALCIGLVLALGGPAAAASVDPVAPDPWRSSPDGRFWVLDPVGELDVTTMPADQRPTPLQELQAVADFYQVSGVSPSDGDIQAARLYDTTTLPFGAPGATPLIPQGLIGEASGGWLAQQRIFRAPSVCAADQLFPDCLDADTRAAVDRAVADALASGILSQPGAPGDVSIPPFADVFGGATVLMPACCQERVRSSDSAAAPPSRRQARASRMTAPSSSAPGSTSSAASVGCLRAASRRWSSFRLGPASAPLSGSSCSARPSSSD